MTYQERQRYQELRQRVDELQERLQAGDPDEPLRRGEAAEILALVDEAIQRMSPERWDRALDAVAEEAARRAGTTGDRFGP